MGRGHNQNEITQIVRYSNMSYLQNKLSELIMVDNCNYWIFRLCFLKFTNAAQ